MQTMPYADFLAILGLSRTDRPDVSDRDFAATEVTIYEDGSAYYTDGGAAVPLASDDARAWRAHVPSQPSWYAVVTFGVADRAVYTGRSVSRDLESCRARARALRQAGCSTVRVVECRTRAEARAADIAGRHPVVYHA